MGARNPIWPPLVISGSLLYSSPHPDANMYNNPDTPEETSDPCFPARLYILDPTGHHGPPIPIGNNDDLLSPAITTICREAVTAGLEVIITDSLDRCMFHAKDGRLIFPTESQREAARGAKPV